MALSIFPKVPHSCKLAWRYGIFNFDPAQIIKDYGVNIKGKRKNNKADLSVCVRASNFNITVEYAKENTVSFYYLGSTQIQRSMLLDLNLFLNKFL